MQYSERYLKEFHRQKASAMENRFPTTGRLNLFEIMLVGLSCCGSLLSPPQLKKLASIEISFDYDSKRSSNLRPRTLRILTTLCNCATWDLFIAAKLLELVRLGLSFVRTKLRFFQLEISLTRNEQHGR